MVANHGCRSYWQRAAQSFLTIGPPLRPQQEDLSFITDAIEKFAARRSDEQFRALLLGVTPAIVQMQWPEGTSLAAVDSSFSMVRSRWPRNEPGQREVVCADWLALPMRSGWFDIAIGDGSMNCVRFPDELRKLAQNVHAVLSEQGLFILRIYARPVRGEQPDDVFADLWRGAIPSFHHFKFRLLMAMQQSSEQGVVLSQVYKAWAERVPDIRVMYERTGWDRRDIETIELYCDSDTVHTFPTLAETRSVLLEFFEEVSISVPSYDLSERCPTLVLRRLQHDLHI